ncbi:CRISPR-associated protein Cmr3 [Caminicella sporogenes DSM 14501]|uniref:CRISPR-associated protein Cmr3 n=1 Tax=Caminicella sporogenes DSM 14501 TaxID=1121266 RepID=A0A1M6LT81_9FIRM|nr:type III-B CRISPR module-associated Cmr3 family protein [Caminicella sporogenes]SHJ74306.1 CRISPR-associated protein Cmr3 [Caminicella sporogenes DSM 14501]
MKVLKIKPNDNLFFGNGKRFDKGESIWLESRLMPYPSVFYGAICSLMLQLNKTCSNRYINNKNNTEDDPRKYLTIRKIYIYDEKNKDVYMKAPLDLFVYKNKCSYGIFRKIESNVCTSSKDMSYFLFNDKKDFKRADEFYIKRSSFYNGYFYGKEVDFYEAHRFITQAYKVGIQREKGMTKDEHLYRIDLTQFNDTKWSYLVEYEIKDEWWNESDYTGLDRGYLKLGGENKSCKYWDVTDEQILKQYKDENDYKNKSKLVKLYISSPFISKYGGYQIIFKDSDKGNKAIKVLGISNKEPLFIGGYDMRTGHKPMYKAIPEGSIYLLESDYFEGQIIKEIKKYIKEQIFLYDEEDSIIKSGFNQFEVVPYREKGE